MPFFSITIPTYNRLPVLQRAVQSVLDQTFPDFELILADDGSTDGTREWAVNHGDKRIHYFYKANSGVCATRNYGADQAKGTYLLFLDSDDYVSKSWLQDFYHEVLNSGADIITCRRALVGKKSGTYQGFLAGTFAVKKTVFDEAGGYDEQLKFGENTELKWRLDAGNYSNSKIESVNVFYEIAEGGGGTNQKNRVDFFYYVRNKHRAFFKKEKATAQLLYQVAGVLCCQLGRKAEGIGLLWKGYFIEPFRIKPLGRAVWHSVKAFF